MSTWTSDPVVRSGVARFVHIVRGPDDPERVSRAEARALGAGFEAWRTDMKGDPEEWADRIVALLGDDAPRTFNHIVLDLTGRLYTADVALDNPPDIGLWLAVGDGRLEHTLESPILFRKSATRKDPKSERSSAGLMPGEPLTCYVESSRVLADGSVEFTYLNNSGQRLLATVPFNPTRSNTMATEPKPKKRTPRPPSEIAEKAILKMPIGQVSALASRLVEADLETAKYLHKKLGEALPAPAAPAT